MLGGRNFNDIGSFDSKESNNSVGLIIRVIVVTI